MSISEKWIRMELIVAKSLYKKYGTVNALDDITFNINTGDRIGILGQNGAGKTTLLMILAGLRYPTSGEINFSGEKLNRTNRKEISRKLGIVFQENSLDRDLTVIENLTLHGVLFGMSQEVIKERINFYIKTIGIDSFKNSLIKNLSGGQKQRVEIAKALLHDPEILLFDEPTVGLDVEMRRDIRTLIKSITEQKKKTILIASHYLEEIEELCDKVIILKNGIVVIHEDINRLRQMKTKELKVRFASSVNKDFLENRLKKKISYEPNSGVYIIPVIDNQDVLQCMNEILKMDILSFNFSAKSLEEIYLNVLEGK